MSIYIGKDQNNNSLIHITKEEMLLGEIDTGNVFPGKTSFISNSYFIEYKHISITNGVNTNSNDWWMFPIPSDDVSLLSSFGSIFMLFFETSNGIFYTFDEMPIGSTFGIGYQPGYALKVGILSSSPNLFNNGKLHVVYLNSLKFENSEILIKNNEITIGSTKISYKKFLSFGKVNDYDIFYKTQTLYVQFLNTSTSDVEFKGISIDNTGILGNRINNDGSIEDYNIFPSSVSQSTSSSEVIKNVYNDCPITVTLSTLNSFNYTVFIEFSPYYSSVYDNCKNGVPLSSMSTSFYVRDSKSTDSYIMFNEYVGMGGDVLEIYMVVKGATFSLMQKWNYQGFDEMRAVPRYHNYRISKINYFMFY